MLTLHYTAETSVPVEVEGIVPTALREHTLAEIERWPVWHGNQQQPLAELFRVTGEAGDERLEFTGNLAGVHQIGAGMSGGEVHIAGHAGRHVGAQMSGGEIRAEGDVGDWLGAELSGGTIRVRGRAGDLVGAAYRGSPRGMTGGTILVHGSAGHEVAHTMRRGLIAIGGDVGDLAGMNMAAGSVVLFGACGARMGAGMRRGSMLVLAARPKLLPTFRVAGPCRPPFVRVYLLALRRYGLDVPDDWLAAEYGLVSGDMLNDGRGEILLRNA